MVTIFTMSAIAKSHWFVGSGEISHLSFSPVLSQWENFDTSTNETESSCYFICITIKQLYLVSIFPVSAIYVPLPVFIGEIGNFDVKISVFCS